MQWWNQGLIHQYKVERWRAEWFELFSAADVQVQGWLWPVVSSTHLLNVPVPLQSLYFERPDPDISVDGFQDLIPEAQVHRLSDLSIKVLA